MEKIHEAQLGQPEPLEMTPAQVLEHLKPYLPSIVSDPKQVYLRPEFDEDGPCGEYLELAIPYGEADSEYAPAAELVDLSLLDDAGVFWRDAFLAAAKDPATLRAQAAALAEREAELERLREQIGRLRTRFTLAVVRLEHIANDAEEIGKLSTAQVYRAAADVVNEEYQVAKTPTQEAQK